ncbi:MAG: peptidylprolyl isomerase [Planctomycetaceae bacterium]
MPWRLAALMLAAHLVQAGAAETATPKATPADPAAARAEFEAADAEMKRVVGELAILQAKWHQPGADRPTLEKKFDALATEGQAIGRRLEAAAAALLQVDPRHAAARKICGATVAAALRGDDPARALATASAMTDAGVADPDVLVMAATAATILSRLDEADDLLKKAVGAGAPAARIAELEESIAKSRDKVAAEMRRREAQAAADDLPRVKLATSAGDLLVELFEDDAPNTVANFVSLVERGYYDGTPFHRVIGGFMAQGGDPTGTGRGGPGHAIACECDLPTARKHFFGSLSMAHAGPNTGGSQFFLTFAPTEHLDGKHTVFGRVIEGFDALPRFARTQDAQGRTVAGIEPDRIVKATMVRKRNHPYEPRTLPDPRK